MIQTQTISATDARNNFFSLIDQSMFEGKSFIVEKNGRPWANLTPPQPKRRKSSSNNLRLFEEMHKLAKTLPPVEESVVDTLRRLRQQNV